MLYISFVSSSSIRPFSTSCILLQESGEAYAQTSYDLPCILEMRIHTHTHTIQLLSQDLPLIVVVVSLFLKDTAQIDTYGSAVIRLQTRLHLFFFFCFLVVVVVVVGLWVLLFNSLPLFFYGFPLFLFFPQK